MDRFLEMRTFVQVVDTGSFVGAAEPLDMSKAAVSRYVADLEARLGVRLLHRTTRRLSLTEDGEVFYLRCKELLGGLDAAEAEVTARSGDAVGQLRVNAPVSFGKKASLCTVSWPCGLWCCVKSPMNWAYTSPPFRG